MKRVIIYCEGPSEKIFINRILVSELIENRVFILIDGFKRLNTLLRINELIKDK